VTPAERWAHTEQRMREIGALEPDWDSYGAGPIPPAALYAVRQLLDSLAIVPCSDGKVDVHLCVHGLEVEISVGVDRASALVTMPGRDPKRSVMVEVGA
jgi:hypothetical protein